MKKEFLTLDDVDFNKFNCNFSDSNFDDDDLQIIENKLKELTIEICYILTPNQIKELNLECYLLKPEGTYPNTYYLQDSSSYKVIIEMSKKDKEGYNIYLSFAIDSFINDKGYLSSKIDSAIYYVDDDYDPKTGDNWNHFYIFEKDLNIKDSIDQFFNICSVDHNRYMIKWINLACDCGDQEIKDAHPAWFEHCSACYECVDLETHECGQ